MHSDKARLSSMSFSRNYRRCLSNSFCLLSLAMLLCAPVWAQPGNPIPTPAAPQPELPKDALGRTTPQGTVLGFLIAGRKGDYELAARYLDTRLQGEQAASLARQLYAVLDRRLPPKLNELSDKPEGSLADLLHPEQELVGTISGDSGNLEILVERADRGESGSVWLFSSKTLDAIPEIYEEINLVPVDRVLPDAVANARFIDVPLFEWFAVFVCIPLFFLFMALLNRLLRYLARKILRRLHGKPELALPDILPIPVRLLLMAWGIHKVNSKVELPLFARQLWNGSGTVIAIIASVWLLILLARWGEAYLSRYLRSRNLSGATSMVRLARWGVDLLIIFAGLLMTLKYFGVNPTGALAGLGVGGIAVAFAAQKTLENLVGGVSLIFDKAVQVGDVLKVGDTRGTVKEIGLRATRILTLDRSLVSVPNGQISTMTLENLSFRDKFWLHPILGLRYDTSSKQMRALLNGIRNLLKECVHVEYDSIRVRFTHFSPSSLEVEVYAYVQAKDWGQFLEVQEELQLQMMECIESTGVQIALPAQNIQLSAPIVSRKGGTEELPETPVAETQHINEAGSNLHE